jgi:hypothetical protein
MCIDYDPPELYEAEMRTARKAHRCEECWREIKPGEKYEYVRGRWEGEFGNAKTCCHCVAARVWLLKECRGFAHGGVQEDLEEHRHNGYRGAKAVGLLRLIAGMRRDWKRFDGAGLMAVPRT